MYNRCTGKTKRELMREVRKGTFLCRGFNLKPEIGELLDLPAFMVNKKRAHNEIAI